MPKYSYDMKCKELAEYFLRDTADRTYEDCAVKLAQIIQDAIEDYIAGNEPV